MQATIMIISPVLRAVVGAPYARAVYANEGLPVDPYAGKACTALVRGIIAFGVFISVANCEKTPMFLPVVLRLLSTSLAVNGGGK